MLKATRDMEYVAGYKNLNLYTKADELVLFVYRITRQFPKEELFGLTSQMRRCAVSVPVNIVEGYGRKTPKDKTQFYYIARGSLNELEYYIDLSYRLNYLDAENYQKISALRNDVGKLLTGFMKSIK